MTRKEEEELVKIFKALDKKIKEQYERKELYSMDCKDTKVMFRWVIDVGKWLGMRELKNYLDSMLKEEFVGKK